MKAHVDQETCIGCGNCVGVCPEVFTMGDSKAYCPCEQVPAECEESAQDACDSCPVAAISIE